MKPVLVINCGQCGQCVYCRWKLRQQVIDQLAAVGKQMNPQFDIDRFKQECAK